MTDAYVVVRVSSSSDGMSCVADDGRLCPYLRDCSYDYCLLFTDRYGLGERLHSDENGMLMRCRQCHEAEARLRADLN